MATQLEKLQKIDEKLTDAQTILLAAKIELIATEFPISEFESASKIFEQLNTTNQELLITIELLENKIRKYK